VPNGPICLLTPLRHFGIYFSPLSVYYCWDQPANDVATVIAEVNNTPWRQKHWYVLGENNRQPRPTDQPGQLPANQRFAHEKCFHVSPFMEMEQRYDWSLVNPTDQLKLGIRSHDSDGMIFSANLDLIRQPLTNWSFSRMLLRYPLAPIQILSAIYFEAFRLWRKKIPYIPNPSTQIPPALPLTPPQSH